MARIRLRYVCKFRNKNRADKRWRYYFRVRGHKAIPLLGQPGSEEFMAAYAQALATVQSKTKAAVEIVSAARQSAPGSVDALIVSYYAANDEWQAFAEDTRAVRRRQIEQFRAKHGPKRVGLLNEAHIVSMMNADNKTPAMRRNWLKTIKHLLQHGVPTMIANSPAANIPLPKIPERKPDGTKRGHWTWMDDQIAAYRRFWKLGTIPRLVFEFALETVSRRGEVVRLGPQHCYTGSEGERRIRIERTHGSEDVDIPMSEALAAAIDAMPKPSLVGGVVPLTYLATERGAQRSKQGLSIYFARWAKQAGLPDECRLHGLKKGGMRRSAESRLTTHELMAKSGHKSLSEVDRYTKAADKKRLADSGAAKMEAMAKGPKRITKTMPVDDGS
jgi:integrase